MKRRQILTAILLAAASTAALVATRLVIMLFCAAWPEAVTATLQTALVFTAVLTPLLFVISKFRSTTFQLTNQLHTVASSGDFFRRLETTEVSEMTILAGEINFILEKLEDVYREKIHRDLLFYTVFSNKHTPMLIINPVNGQIQDANPAAAMLYQYPVGSLKKMNIDDLSLTVKLPLILELYHASKNTPRADLEFRQKKADGSAVEVAVNSHLIMADAQESLFWIVTDLTDQRSIEQNAQDSEMKFSKFMDLSPDGIVITDETGTITGWNPAEAELTRISQEEAFGQKIWDIQARFTNPASASQVNQEIIRQQIMDILVKGNSRWLNDIHEIEIFRNDGSVRTLQTRIFMLKSIKGYQICSISRDVTEKKKMEMTLISTIQEKITLLREIHHRVKNNLQIISSLLFLQTDFIKDSRTKEIFEESQNRVKTMAIIHEKLYRSTELSRVPFDDYLKDLTDYLFTNYQVSAEKIRYELMADKLEMNIQQAVPCGLIINELVTNTIKYGFPGQKKGVLTLEFNTLDGFYHLKISDNGIGMKTVQDPKKMQSFGLRLVSDLAYQLDAQTNWTTDHGTSFEMMFPVRE